MRIGSQVLGISYGRDRWDEVVSDDWGQDVYSVNVGHAVRILERGMRPHFVYFLEVRNDFLEMPPMVKIGTTATPDSRITQLVRGLHKGPDWLTALNGDCDHRCLGIVVGDEELEGELHKAFRSHRIAGEWFWFEPVEHVIDFILTDYCVCADCLQADGWHAHES